MEMSINFKNLFNFDESGSNTPSTSSLQNSYHIDEPSIISTGSNNINIHYKFNEGLFFDTTHQGDERGLNISGDLSSIGRSFQQDYQQKGLGMRQEFYKQQRKYKATTKNIKNDNEFKNSKKGHSTIYLNEKDTTLKTPGQRLYYESKIKNERKLKQLQRIKQQFEQQLAKQVTFKPVLNQKSKKILQLADSPLRKMQNMKKTQKQQQKHVKQLKSTVQRKQQEQLKNCTFKPAILKTPKSIISSTPNRSSNKDLSSVFDSLYNQHKVKIQRKRKLVQQQQQKKKSKTMSKQQLQQFFHRNQQYIQEKKHRQQLLKAVSSQYDLTSGRKLFQPKINVTSSSTGQLVGSLSMVKFSSAQQLNSNKSQKRIKQANHLSQKNKKLNKPNINNKKLDSNLNKNSQQRKLKPMAYQVTKFIAEQKGIQQNDDDYQKQGDAQIFESGRQYSYMSNPKSSIFNKIAITEQQHEIHQQEISQQQSEEQNNMKQEYQKYDQGQQQYNQGQNYQRNQQKYETNNRQQQYGQDNNYQLQQSKQHRKQTEKQEDNKQDQNQQQQRDQNSYQNGHQHRQSQNEQIANQSIDNGQLLDQQVQKDEYKVQSNSNNHSYYDNNYQSQRSLPHQPTQKLFTDQTDNNNNNVNNHHQDQYHNQLTESYTEQEDHYDNYQQEIGPTQIQQGQLSNQIQQQKQHVDQPQLNQPHQQANQQDEQQFHPYQQEVTQQQYQSHSHHINNQNYQQPQQQYLQQQNQQQQQLHQNNTDPQQQQQHLLQLHLIQQNSRKQSQDDDITKRTNFLQSVVKNPIYTHKYNDLLSLDQNQQQSYLKTSNNHPIAKQTQPINNTYQSIYNSKQQLLPILNPNQPNINPYQLNKQKPSTSPKKPSLFAPIFLSKDSQQQSVQEKVSPKSWQEIFNASSKIEKDNIAPSQSGLSQRSRISQLKVSSNLSPQQSPKKKAINIASLLKAKKKQTPKA